MSLEDCQLLTWAWMLVKAIYSRQKADPDLLARDRAFGRWIGGSAQFGFYRLFEMIQPIYEEFYLAFNQADDVEDDPFEPTYLETAGGPQGGPAVFLLGLAACSTSCQNCHAFALCGLPSASRMAAAVA